MGYKWIMGIPWRKREEEKMVIFFGKSGIGIGVYICILTYVIWFYKLLVHYCLNSCVTSLSAYVELDCLWLSHSWKSALSNATSDSGFYPESGCRGLQMKLIHRFVDDALL